MLVHTLPLPRQLLLLSAEPQGQYQNCGNYFQMTLRSRLLPESDELSLE